MGLDINKYSSSYHTLHMIRKWVIECVEKNPIDYKCPIFDNACGKCMCCLYEQRKDVTSLTKFPELIFHSDCDGGYKDPVTDNERCGLMWGSLAALKNEIKLLKKFEKDIPKNIKQSYLNLKEDILSSNKKLLFR